MRVVFMGLGYIGLPTAALVASKGIPVTGVDINPHIVETVNRGKIHIVEPDLEEMVNQVVEKKRLLATDTPERADVFVIAVPTPFKQNHIPDTSYVEAATHSIIPLLEPGNLFIIESTSPVGTTDRMAKLVFKERPELKGRLSIAYCPERVLPGNVLYELEHNERVIGGIDTAAAEKAAKFYQNFVTGALHLTDAKTAEMCKLTENASRDAQIAFANELSMICDRAGINVWELIELANKHPRVNILRPGSGVGGHCIAVDPYFLTADFPEESQLISKAREINNYKTNWCINKIQKAVADFTKTYGKKPVVALMGLAFKPDIDDLRESPAKHIAEETSHRNDAEYLWVEPNLPESTSEKQLSPPSLVAYKKAYTKADIVVFLVAHTPFKSLPPDPDKIILDFAGVFHNKK